MIHFIVNSFRPMYVYCISGNKETVTGNNFSCFFLQVFILILFCVCSGLEEGNEELQAQMLNRSLTEGRQLLVSQAHNNSLAAEFEAMSENEVSSAGEEGGCEFTLSKGGWGWGGGFTMQNLLSNR